MSNTVQVLYFNGLGYGRLRRREELAIHYLKRCDIKVTHAPVDWYAGESFEDLFARMLVLTRK